MKEKRWKVYVHIFPNNKKYYGITNKKNPNERWESGHGYSFNHQPVMYNAIQKYGWGNIKHIILFENLSEEEAKQKEIELIRDNKTNCKKYGDEYGYNMTDGGDGTLGHVVSEESKRKMSLKAKGRNKGKNCYKSKSVITKEKEWETISDFAKENNLVRSTVSKWLYGKCAMPKYWYEQGLRFKNENHNITMQNKPHKFTIEIDGIMFNSQAEFSKYIGELPSNTCKWINSEIPEKYIKRGFKRINTFDLD